MESWLIKVAFFLALSAFNSDGSNIEWNNPVSNIVDRNSATETEVEENGGNQEESEDEQQDLEEESKSTESQNESADEPEEAAKVIEEESDQHEAMEENEAETEEKAEASANSSNEKQQHKDTEGKSENTADFDHYPTGQFAVEGAEGETVENNTGIFTIEKQAADIDPVEVGPIHIQFENIQMVSGDVTEEAIAGIAGDQVKFIQMNAILQNTSDDPMQFFFASTTLQLNGEQLVAHDMFSGESNGNYETQTPRNTTLVYMLNDENLVAEEINELTVQITGVPINMNTDQATGSGTSFDVAF